MHELPTGTVTLLFTDMEGSTRLLQLLGKRYADVLAECRDLMRAAFQQHRFSPVLPGRSADPSGTGRSPSVGDRCHSGDGYL